MSVTDVMVVFVVLQEGEDGLYVCMNTFRGLGRRFVEKYFQKTGNAVFLHLRKLKKEV